MGHVLLILMAISVLKDQHIHGLVLMCMNFVQACFILRTATVEVLERFLDRYPILCLKSW